MDRYYQRAYEIGINFTSADKNQYAYKLIGFDSDWNEVGDQRLVSFTNLLPGTYTLHVKASNNDGLRNEEGAKLTFKVLPLWWKEPWFQLLFWVVVTTLVVLLYKIRVRTIKQQNKRLEELVKTRTKEVVLQRDEISIQAEELQAQTEELAAQNEENIALNDQLEVRVKERTRSLEERNNRLIEYAQNNAHIMRAPLARLLGLTDITKISKTNDMVEIKDLINKIEESGNELDGVIRRLGKKLTDETGVDPFNTPKEE
jgi:signal transduction histidine kinase